MRLLLRLAVAGSLIATAARAQVTVTVDASADQRPISPLIYGMNFADAQQIAAARLPLTRWGGNGTSRYNYQIDTTNTGSDYFFENVPGCWSAAANYCAVKPTDPLGMSGANAFLDGAQKSGLTVLFTIPALGWVAKAPPKYGHPFDCGCPKSALPNQDSFDPYDGNCGNGQQGGKFVACPAATTTSQAADATWAGQWAKYLVGKFGPSNGKRIYELDNEPALWSSTHHDVHPTRLGYDELWQRMRDTANALLDADPTAQISGPAEWGWPNYFCSDLDDVAKGCSAQSPDRAQHGGAELMAWLLDQARAYEQQKGRRVLHALDLHYYPQGGSGPDNTRSLWDGSYTDPSWIGDKIRLIPRMRDWVAQHYPGTRIVVSEYDWGHHNDATGLVTYAEVLGIFGREGLDGATAWSPPGAGEVAFGAYAIFGNWDGAGAGFERTSVRATVTGSATVKAFAAVGASRATVVLVNELGQAQSVAVTLKGFQAGASGRLIVATGAKPGAPSSVAIASGTATVTVPPMAVALLAVDGQGPMLPDMAMSGGVDLARASDGSAASSDGRAGDGDGGGAGGSGGGCSCAVGGGGSPSAGIALFVALGLARIARRRRR